MKTVKILFVLIFFSAITYGQELEEKGDAKSLMSSYYNKDFNPFNQGNWMVSFNMSFKKENFLNTNYNFEKIVDGSQKSSNYEIGGAYFFSDNFAGKLGFLIGHKSFEGDIAKTLDTISRNSFNKNYAVAPALRSSIPLVPSKRLSIFVDLGIQLGWGNTEYNDRGRFGVDEISHSSEFLFGTGIKSGITFFAIENFAIEIGMDILSYKYTTTKSVDFEEPESRYDTHEVDFSIDLLSLNLALAYYIGSK